MKNEEIAKLLGNHCFNANTSDLDYAVQLFIEKVVLPKEVDGYNAEEMGKYILAYLNGIK
ncbi:MAG: hypothetical protein ABS939_00780 [Psychrobacillus sp.]